MTHTPTARRDGLIVRELKDETLVYDLERDEAHCLNQTAALVWKHCDGLKSVAEIATLLEAELQAIVDEQVVWLALAQLRRKRLLSERVSRTRSSPRISRREMAHRLVASHSARAASHHDHRCAETCIRGIMQSKLRRAADGRMLPGGMSVHC